MVFERIPGLNRLSMIAGSAQALVYSSGATIIDSQHKRMRQNFTVLAMGINSGVVIPKVLGKCKKFVKDNHSDWLRSKHRTEEVFYIERIIAGCETEEYVKADAVWIEKKFLPWLKWRHRQDKLVFLKLIKRQK